ncbi:MAG TPA: glycosyltransferase [Polyangiaceae bacterium]|jgi:glycosyltransferase involved in cell wall biosynthesis
MNVSILVPAHNEAANIQGLLQSLLEQRTRAARIAEIVVVASGCTDDTAGLARKTSAGRPGMHVHVQERRAGKVAAINEYLKIRDQRADIIVMCSADLRVAPDVVERIAMCFRDHPDVGMVGARPVPDNDGSTMVGKMVHLLWEMHHRIALEHPKMGELVAFRANLTERVSELSVVDEASIEDVIRSKGYGLAYIPDAVVTNHGPETWREYFEQRRRIARGHYWLDFAFGYSVATLDPAILVRTATGVAKEESMFGRGALVTAIATEVAARAAGFFDARILGGKHRTWKQLRSTKRLKDVGDALARATQRPPPMTDGPLSILPGKIIKDTPSSPSMSGHRS